MEVRKLHVIFGFGPLGQSVQRQLSARGERVRIVNRSGQARVDGGVEVERADASDPTAAVRAAEGAHVIYHCAQPPYGRWPALAPALTRGILAAAEATGARLVYGDNLYLYGRTSGTIHEDLADAATGPNGSTRAALARTLLEAHDAGRARVTIGRASDFYGPGVLDSKFGAGVFPRALQGKPAQVLGDPDQPHTVTFIDDFARALVTLGEHDVALGKAWHVPNPPTLTTREFIRLVYREAGIEGEPKLQQAPKLGITFLSLWNPTMRAVREMLYQSEQPWVVSHERYAAAFGDHATPHSEAIRTTIDWYRRSQDMPPTS